MKEKYQNPILCMDYSDPDIIRAGDLFYMAASSFTYVPGVPVLCSQNLVEWKLIGHCLKKIPFEKFDRPVHGCGAWAPSIRCHNGKFYVFIPFPDEGIYVVTAEDPAGEWSEPHCVKEARGWIDPCPLWDDDGRVYMAFAYAGSRCGIKHRLNIVELDPLSLETIGEPVCVFDGTLCAPTIEGPKLYKRNGYYYILAPAGGVATGWQLALRSRDIYGPYEYRTVLHQGNTKINGPHQGGYVDLPDGSCWFLHFQDAGNMGRILHLQPMAWINDWPFIGVEQNGDGIGEPVLSYDLPVQTNPAALYDDPSVQTGSTALYDDFSGKDLALQWQWQCNPKEEWYQCLPDEKKLRLFIQKDPAHAGSPLWFAGNALTLIPSSPDFEVTLELTLHPREDGDMAGLGTIGHKYSCLALAWQEQKFIFKLIKGTVRHHTLMGMQEGEVFEEEVLSFPAQTTPQTISQNQTCPVFSGFPVPSSLPCQIRMTIHDASTASYAYKTEGKDFKKIPGEYPILHGTWTGFKVTVFALNQKTRDITTSPSDDDPCHNRKPCPPSSDPIVNHTGSNGYADLNNILFRYQQ